MPRSIIRAREIVSRTVEGEIHRTDYAADPPPRPKLAGALKRRGVKPGDRVATLAWNTHRHMEAWYGIAGAGAVYHTLNPRLFPDQIAWIANHGGARDADVRHLLRARSWKRSRPS